MSSVSKRGPFCYFHDSWKKSTSCWLKQPIWKKYANAKLDHETPKFRGELFSDKNLWVATIPRWFLSDNQQLDNHNLHPA